MDYSKVLPMLQDLSSSFEDLRLREPEAPKWIDQANKIMVACVGGVVGLLAGVVGISLASRDS